LRMDGKAARTVTFDSVEFRQFDHGYAVTSHSSQGLTAGRVLAHIDTESSRNLINNRLAYVSISRASDDARIYTNNAADLGERLSSEVTKSAAVDSARAEAKAVQNNDLIRNQTQPMVRTIRIEEQGLGL
jgi:ATP-dependent exoDNAse (exonuclease V) alpha subunit